MGETDISDPQTEESRRAYLRLLLRDIEALERMHETGLLESGVRRIGAEQEVAIIDESGAPLPISDELLARLPGDAFTTELGRYNLEINLEPLSLGGFALRDLEQQLHGYLGQVRAVARDHEALIVLAGILPSLGKGDLTLDNLTPRPRYAAMNEALTRLRGGPYELNIAGTDDLVISHDNIMLESCNTSFQLHFQVDPESFAHWYNIAQAVSAPVLAASVNSPVLLGRRLWKETRIALFQQAIDTRKNRESNRHSPSRVTFGSDWVNEGVLEIFREDIARFKPLFYDVRDEDAMVELNEGRVPSLTALRLFNGTVYRWNRPCYGVYEGKPHLRIENRILPAGPTPIDEVANTALWLGLMRSMSDEIGDVRKVMKFEDVSRDFVSAARYGLESQLHWTDGSMRPARDLILEEILPAAARGLESSGIDSDDIERYLSVIEKRTSSGRTGAAWILDSMADADESEKTNQLLARITAGIAERQLHNAPGHTWDLLDSAEFSGDRRHVKRVEQIMTTDLFTVHKDDVIDLVTNLMDWKHLRHIPVEDDDRHLVGLVTYRDLIRHLKRIGGLGAAEVDAASVSSIMKTDLVTVGSDTSTVDAFETMIRESVSCLPVIDGGRLVGIVTDYDFMKIAEPMISRFLEGDQV